MLARALVPGVLLLAGAGLTALAIADGSAHLAWVLIVPVVYGSSPGFAAGVVLMAGGLLTLPLALAPHPAAEEEGTGPTVRSRGGVGTGGFVLIGPVPILFGTWREVSRRTRWLLAVAGGTAVVASVLVALALLG
ncbi:MAG TPA: DUF131 domain-containing protein [Thermoplasmata archaeon]|nr:DUF131 domain-containing protein [Thermoplasmata archaeon]